MREPIVSLRDGESLADYAIRLTAERDEARAEAARLRVVEDLALRMAQERDEAREKAAQWEKACPQSSVCPKCGMQTIYRWPEPPGIGEFLLVEEIMRLRALLRECRVLMREATDLLTDDELGGAFVPGGWTDLLARLAAALEERDG